MAFIGIHVFQWFYMVSIWFYLFLYDFECGFDMILNVGMYMTTNVGMYMTTNVAVICLRMWACMWLRMSQWYDYEHRSYMTTNLAVICLRISQLYDDGRRSYMTTTVQPRRRMCGRNFRMSRLSWMAWKSRISIYPPISRMSRFSPHLGGLECWKSNPASLCTFLECIPGFRGFPGNGVSTWISDPPKHTQES